MRRHRLPTITGPGDVGKTRLDLALADALRDGFLDGCVVVSLAHLREPAFVAPAIARALGLWDTAAPVQDRLLDRLRAARMLLCSTTSSSSSTRPRWSLPCSPAALP